MSSRLPHSNNNLIHHKSSLPRPTDKQSNVDITWRKSNIQYLHKSYGFSLQQSRLFTLKLPLQDSATDEAPVIQLPWQNPHKHVPPFFNATMILLTQKNFNQMKTFLKCFAPISFGNTKGFCNVCFSSNTTAQDGRMTAKKESSCSPCKKTVFF